MPVRGAWAAVLVLADRRNLGGTAAAHQMDHGHKAEAGLILPMRPGARFLSGMTRARVGFSPARAQGG
jgi:hypothetical protein